MPAKWEKVYIFISSTFEDMHAERDFLVKKVFPELTQWCEGRRLKLVDVDLRWGVTETDAVENMNVINVCLNRIDECRPFFLCFLGQRRGWVPTVSDINENLINYYPEITNYLGDTSITEMEILHAVIKPFQKLDTPSPADHAFFFLRDGSYLRDIPAEPALIGEIFTHKNNNANNNEEELTRWTTEIIPRTGRPVFNYQAAWDGSQTTSEIALPLICPSNRENVLQRWRQKWQTAGITVDEASDCIDTGDIDKANEFNKKLCAGRLTDFKSGGIPLEKIITQNLKNAISMRFPDHTEIGDETDYDKEMRLQEEFLVSSGEGFVERGDDFAELDSYANSAGDKVLVLAAPSGMGKSMLLANWILKYREKNKNGGNCSLHYKFVGATDKSSQINQILLSILTEIKATTAKLNEDIPASPVELRKNLFNTLSEIGSNGKTIIVIDGLDQLETGITDMDWLIKEMPKGIKLIISFKTGIYSTDIFYNALNSKGRIIPYEIRPFDNRSDRIRLVRTYLSKYLKELDERHIDAIVDCDGAANPLYLKVVLSELRVFGSFLGIKDKIHNDFGDNTITAFTGVLNRLESDPAYSVFQPSRVVELLFGSIANSRHGLTVEELEYLFKSEFGSESIRDIDDTIHMFIRQVRSFMVRKGGRFDFFYESFKIAAKEKWKDKKLYINSLLAACFRCLADAGNDGRWTGNNARALAELPYHLSLAGRSGELTSLMRDLTYLDARCFICDVYELLRDYELLKDIKDIKDANDTIADKHKDLIFKNADKLKTYSNLFFSLLQHEGFEEARNDADVLLSQNKWRKPWIKTKPVNIQMPSDASQEGERVNLGGVISFPTSCAVSNASKKDKAYFVKSIGQVGIIDTKNMEQLSNIITIRALRPLELFTPDNASYLTVVFENGEADIIKLIYDDDGNFLYQQDMTHINYLLPDFENPVMLWDGSSLWFQNEEGSICKLSFTDGACNTDQFETPSDCNGELSGCAVCGQYYVFAFRKKNSTAIVALHNDGTPAGMQHHNSDMSCMCAHGDLLAAGFYDNTLSIYDLSNTNDLSNGFKSMNAIGIGRLAKVLSLCDDSLIGITDRQYVFSWDYKGKNEVNFLSDEGGLFTKRISLKLRSLIRKDNGMFQCVTDSKAFDFEIAGGDNYLQYSIQSIFDNGSGDICAISKIKDQLCLIWDKNTDNVLIADKASMLYHFPIDGKGCVFGTSALGTGVLIDICKKSVRRLSGIPYSISSAAGSPDGGFWLSDRDGKIYGVDYKGNVDIVADMSKRLITGPSLTSWDDLVILRSINHQTGEFGTDANFLITFFSHTGGLRLAGKGERQFYKDDGHLFDIAYDHMNKNLYMVMAPQDEEGILIRHGKIKDYINKTESAARLSFPDRTITRAVYSVCDDCIYLLSNAGNVFAISPGTFEISAVLSAQKPFTAITLNQFTKRELFLIKDDKIVFRIESGKYVRGGGK